MWRPAGTGRWIVFQGKQETCRVYHEIRPPSRQTEFFDLMATRKYLSDLGRELQHAAASQDPRVVLLALGLVEYQGRERVQ